MNFNYYFKRRPVVEEGTQEQDNEMKSPELKYIPNPRCCCKKAVDNKLHNYDWLWDVPESEQDTDLVEIQFKNTRKGYFRNSLQLPLFKGDIVAVEATPGHDVGEVTLTGRLVLLQMKKNGVRLDSEIKRVYRKAKQTDLEKWEESKGKEHDTMLRSRQIAENLKLDMKIGDVEYQGDGNKAIFYYIADERVDFRQLIKVLAETFKVRIEMKQIGARQEAGRIGGIGPCGRELCCSGWMSNFTSVSTSAARYQDISLNPQKLAGQCAKLKCCLNFEVDCYVEANKKLPSREINLETADATFYHFKTDIFKEEVTYSTDRHMPVNLITISSMRVFEIISMNKRGTKPLSLIDDGKKPEPPKRGEQDILDQNNITRFDKRKGDKNKKRREKGNVNNGTPEASEGEVIEAREAREPKENGERREKRDRRQKERREPREGSEQREPKENKQERREPKEGSEQREPREQREQREPREPKENKQERREPREREERREKVIPKEIKKDEVDASDKNIAENGAQQERTRKKKKRPKKRPRPEGQDATPTAE